MGAEFVECWGTALFTRKLRDAVQGVNTHIKYVSVFIDQTNGFLGFAVDIYGFQTRKLTNTVINMSNVIAFLKLVNFFEREGLFGLLEPFF